MRLATEKLGPLGTTTRWRAGVLCSVFEQQYGYFEARLKVPAGQGMWPAFWLLGKTGSTGVNEIDIHEILGHQPSTVYMTVYWGTDYSAGHQSDGTNWVGPDFFADFHTFGLEWNPDAIIWTIDGVERKRHTGTGGASWTGRTTATGGATGSGGIASNGGSTGSGGALGTAGASASGGSGTNASHRDTSGCGCRLAGTESAIELSLLVLTMLARRWRMHFGRARDRIPRRSHCCSRRVVRVRGPRTADLQGVPQRVRRSGGAFLDPGNVLGHRRLP